MGREFSLAGGREMGMEYPLMINGEARGTLSEREDGLFTVFEATAFDVDALVRLAVYGGGEEGYLGVMQPRSGGMYLTRRMTRRERAALPGEIEYAAPAGERRGEGVSIRERELANAESAAVDEDMSEDDDGDDGLIWYSRPDGTLTAFDGHGSLIALPADMRREAEDAVMREINGRRYMLFRY